MDWMPPFASGKIAGSYKLLYRYLSIAKEKGRDDVVDKAVLSERDYEALRRLAKDRVSMAELLDKLTIFFIDRVDPDIALEALRSEGLNVSREDARRMIARLLAMWLVEASETWNIIKFSGSQHNL